MYYTKKKNETKIERRTQVYANRPKVYHSYLCTPYRSSKKLKDPLPFSTPAIPGKETRKEKSETRTRKEKRKHTQTEARGPKREKNRQGERSQTHRQADPKRIDLACQPIANK